MSTSKTSEQNNGVSLLGLMNAKPSDNSKLNSGDKLIEIVPVFQTPFTIVTKDDKSFIALGSYRLTEDTDDVKDLFQLIEEKDWNLMTNLFGAMIHLNNQTK